MSMPYMPTAGVPDDPQWNGIYAGQVAVTQDPLNEGRVRLFVPQVLGTAQSNWATAMQPGITPEAGTTVLVIFLGGNINLPYYFIGVDQTLVAAITSGTDVLNANPFFTGGVLAPWTATNGTLTAVTPNVDTDPPFLYGALWQATATGGGYVSEMNEPFVAVAGNTYMVQAWVYYPLGGEINLGFYWTGQDPTTNAYTVPAGTWTMIQDIETAPGPSGNITGWPVVGPAESNVGDQMTVEAVLVLGGINGAMIIPGTVTGGPGGALAGNTIEIQNIDQTTVTARALGGITTTISAFAPANGNAGDIWINSTNGNQLYQFDGTNWNPLTWTASDVIEAGTIVTELIAANAITAGQIAANSIYAGAIQAGAIDGTTINGVTINGNTINAADVIITATDGGLFVYGTGGTVVKTFTSSTTWTCPTGVSTVKVECYGAGGGGGGQDTSSGSNGGGGGGGGAYSVIASQAVTATDVYTVTVAGGGAAGANNGSGGTAGVTEFVSPAPTVLCSANGGGGGGTNGTAGAGGSTAGVGGLYAGGAGGVGTDGAGGSPGDQNYNTAGSGNWTCPSDVYSVTAQVWGAGGGGAGPYIGSNYAATGGGGGGFSQATLSVTPGSQYAYQVGALGNRGPAHQGNGGDGTFSSFTVGSTVVKGGGGHGGEYGANSQALGGAGTGGTINYNGGNSGVNTNGEGPNPPAYGSGGGSAAGYGRNGAVGGTGGCTTQGPGGVGIDGGGDGGSGGTFGGDGYAGAAPGGGGGGGGNTSTTAGYGGNGAPGQVYLYWTTNVQEGGGGGAGAISTSAGQAGTTENGGTTGNSNGGDIYGTPTQGGGGLGYDGTGQGLSGPQAGAGGMVVLTYTYSTATMIASFCGEAGALDPLTSTACPEGLTMWAAQSVYWVGTSGESAHGAVNAPAARTLTVAAPMTVSSDAQAKFTMTSAATGSTAEISTASNLYTSKNMSAAGTVSANSTPAADALNANSAVIGTSSLNSPSVYSSGDGQTYTFGQNNSSPASTVTCTTSATVITSVNVTAGITYWLHGSMVFIQGSGATTLSCGWDGSSSCKFFGQEYFVGGSAQVSNSSAPLLTSPSISGTMIFVFDFLLTVQTTGSLSLRGQTNAGTVLCSTGSFQVLLPLS
jgi:Type VI secretion system/phage-baseplate injector OB domain